MRVVRFAQPFAPYRSKSMSSCLEVPNSDMPMRSDSVFGKQPIGALAKSNFLEKKTTPKNVRYQRSSSYNKTTVSVCYSIVVFWLGVAPFVQPGSALVTQRLDMISSPHRAQQYARTRQQLYAGGENDQDSPDRVSNHVRY